MTALRRLPWQAGFTLVVLAAAGLLLAGPYRFLLGNAAGSPAEQARPGNCLPGRAVDIMDSPHIAPTRADSIAYNSSPPTSGPHFAFPVATGVYDRSVAEGLTIHAMEHGHVVIQYAPSTPDQEVDRLASLARRYGADVVLAPYPPLRQGIALTAWGRIDLLDIVEESRVAAFVEAHRGRYQHGWTTEQDCPAV